MMHDLLEYMMRSIASIFEHYKLNLFETWPTLSMRCLVHSVFQNQLPSMFLSTTFLLWPRKLACIRCMIFPIFMWQQMLAGESLLRKMFAVRNRCDPCLYALFVLASCCKIYLVVTVCYMLSSRDCKWWPFEYT
jgi:hypothetical protein